MRHPLCLALLLSLAGTTVAQDMPKPAAKAKAKPKARRPRRVDGTYMGREIAPAMSFEGGGAEWLMRPERIEEEQPEKMIDALKLKPGMTVADVGAGVGYTTLRMARRVAPGGVILATDIQLKMVKALEERAREAGVKNVKPLLATADDPRLPEAGVDLALMVDVYHECADPAAMLAALRKALKPDGRLVLVEFRGEDDSVPINPVHKMTVAQVRKELEANGFAMVEAQEFLPWQHILIFGKAGEDAAKGKAESKAGGDR